MRVNRIIFNFFLLQVLNILPKNAEEVSNVQVPITDLEVFESDKAKKVHIEKLLRNAETDKSEDADKEYQKLLNTKLFKFLTNNRGEGNLILHK